MVCYYYVEIYGFELTVMSNWETYSNQTLGVFDFEESESDMFKKTYHSQLYLSSCSL